MTPHPARLRELSRIARPQSVVILAETVRAARELHLERVEPLKEQVNEGDYAVSSKRLAERVLATLH